MHCDLTVDQLSKLSTVCVTSIVKNHSFTFLHSSKFQYFFRMKKRSSMQDSIKKFTKYATNVEEDLEQLIFAMLDLIDSKTSTLRKLIKLRLHIKRAKLVANLKFKKKASTIFPSQLDESFDDLDEHTTTVSHTSLSKLITQNETENISVTTTVHAKDSDTLIEFSQSRINLPDGEVRKKSEYCYESTETLENDTVNLIQCIQSNDFLLKDKISNSSCPNSESYIENDGERIKIFRPRKGYEFIYSGK